MKRKFEYPLVIISIFNDDEIICTSGEPEQFTANGTYADDGKWNI